MADDTTATPPPKPGWKTTEFWLTLVTLILSMAYASGLITSDTSPVGKAIVFAAGILKALGYTVSRTLVKTGP